MPDPPARHHVLWRAFAVWLVLIGVEFVNGALRTIFLVLPRVSAAFRNRHSPSDRIQL